MNLSELKWACELYGQLGTPYDASLRTFRRCVAPTFDVSKPEHRACLFTWLNKWKCRQFALEHHMTTASDSLIHWANVWLERLPPADVLLTNLDPAEIRRGAAAYEALRDETASFKKRDGRLIAATFGKTGAAKTLFALRPMVFPPWDEQIREALGFKRGSCPR